MKTHTHDGNTHTNGVVLSRSLCLSLCRRTGSGCAGHKNIRQGSSRGRHRGERGREREKGGWLGRMRDGRRMGNWSVQLLGGERDKEPRECASHAIACAPSTSVPPSGDGVSPSLLSVYRICTRVVVLSGFFFFSTFLCFRLTVGNGRCGERSQKRTAAAEEREGERGTERDESLTCNNTGAVRTCMRVCDA